MYHVPCPSHGYTYNGRLYLLWLHLLWLLTDKADTWDVYIDDAGGLKVGVFDARALTLSATDEARFGYKHTLTACCTPHACCACCACCVCCACTLCVHVVRELYAHGLRTVHAHCMCLDRRRRDTSSWPCCLTSAAKAVGTMRSGSCRTARHRKTRSRATSQQRAPHYCRDCTPSPPRLAEVAHARRKANRVCACSVGVV